MKSKKSWGIAFAVIIIIYFIVGYYYLSFSGDQVTGKSKNLELTNNEGQEFAIQMKDAERNAKEDGQLAYKKIDEGNFTRNELIEELESSKTYLQNKLKEVAPDNANYIELLYNSAFLIGFSQNYGESEAEIKRQIEKHNLIRTANDMHNYIVGRLYESSDEITETELTEKMGGINEEEVEQLVDLMME